MDKDKFMLFWSLRNWDQSELDNALTRFREQLREMPEKVLYNPKDHDRLTPLLAKANLPGEARSNVLVGCVFIA